MEDVPLIRLTDVGFSYRTDPVLEHISLDIKKGDYLGIIGPNGSGKTTLLKIILGLLAPTCGTIELFGLPQKQFRQWSNIGYVPQRAGIADSRFPVSVEEIVWMASGKMRDVLPALKSVDMEEYRKRPLSELSGGQQQRVYIARALVTDPEILILDEPTVGVDAQSQSRFYELLEDLNGKKGKTLVMVSHDVDVVAHEVKTVACINRTMVCHGKPHDIIHGGVLEKVYGGRVGLVVHGH